MHGQTSETSALVLTMVMAMLQVDPISPVSYRQFHLDELWAFAGAAVVHGTLHGFLALQPAVHHSVRCELELRRPLDRIECSQVLPGKCWHHWRPSGSYGRVLYLFHRCHLCVVLGHLWFSQWYAHAIGFHRLRTLSGKRLEEPRQVHCSKRGLDPRYQLVAERVHDWWSHGESSAMAAQKEEDDSKDGVQSKTC